MPLKKGKIKSDSVNFNALESLTSGKPMKEVLATFPSYELEEYNKAHAAGNK